MKSWKKAHSEGIDSEFIKGILKRVADCKSKLLKKEEAAGPKAPKDAKQPKVRRTAFQKKWTRYMEEKVILQSPDLCMIVSR